MIDRQPTPFSELNAVLAELVAGTQAILGDEWVGVYLQGSFAVGDFDEHSDVDFLVVIRNGMPDTMVPGLQALHSRLHDMNTEWARHLEGSYIPVDVLRSADRAGEPIWYLDNGSRELVRSDHDNTLVVRWVLWEHGISLSGPNPRGLADPVGPDDLRREVMATMEDWGRQLLSDPGQMNNQWYQPYAVLSYCRMLHTLHTGRVRSKRAGAEWAVRTLDSRWAPLIERAWQERPDPSQKVKKPADAVDLADTVRFIAYAIREGRLLQNS